MQVAFNIVIHDSVLLHHEHLLSTVRTLLRSLKPIREATPTVSVKARHQRNSLMHDHVANATVELITHIIDLLFHVIILFLSFMELLFVVSHFFFITPFVTIIVNLTPNLFWLCFFREIDQDHKNETNFILLFHIITFS